MAISDVRSFYDRTVKDEFVRLDECWLEHDVTITWIRRMLAETSDVLDLGGGPGRYAFELASLGHRVTLADLSNANLEAARKQQTDLAVSLVRIIQADARDLSQLKDNSYDFVLCLGPIYHLIGEADREIAMKEVFRLLRPGGIAFVGFLSRYAVVHYFAKRQPELLRDNVSTINQILLTGINKPNSKNDFFTDARFDPPDTITDLITRTGGEVLKVFGAEGGLAQSDKRLKSVCEETQSELRNLAIELSDQPPGIFGSEHLVVICRRPNDYRTNGFRFR